MANYDEFAHICSCTRELILAGLEIFIDLNCQLCPLGCFQQGRSSKFAKGGMIYILSKIYVSAQSGTIACALLALRL